MTMPKAVGLTSTTTQTSARFFFGNAFSEGELPSGTWPHLDPANVRSASSYIVSRWPDGSVRLATFTGTTSLTADTEKQINIVSRNYAPAASTGTALTTANIAACGATATVQFGTLGIVSLSSATLVQVHYTDAQMICAEYRAKLGTTGLSVQFFVWLFADGLWYQRVTPWNGFIFDGSAQRDYVPTVTIDGTMVYNNGGVAYKHSPNTWYTFTRWSNGSAITPRHDTAKLIDSRLFPNYLVDTPQAANRTYCASISNYTPGANLGLSVTMGSTGGQDDIGPMPMWEAMYFVNRGEKVALDAVIANSHALGSYAVHHCDPTTLRSIKLSDYPNYTQSGAGQGGNNNYGSVAQDGSQLTYEIAHHPAPPKLATVLTGDPFYMQLCQYVAATCYLAITSAGGSGVNRIVGQQPRGVAWTLRSVSDAAVVCPTSQAAYYEHAAWYGNQIAYYSNLGDGITGVSGFKVGMIDQYDNYQAGNNFAGVPFWQHDFLAMAVGQAAMMKVGSSTALAKTLNFLGYLSNNAAWRTSGQYFTYCAQYYFLIPKSTAVSDTSPLAAANASPSSAADIFNTSLDSSAIATLGDNTLHTGGSTGLGAGSYIDQFVSALSYFCNFNLPGALAGRAKVLGATNAAALTDPASRGTTPAFAIAPLTVTHTPTFTAVDSGSGATVTSPILGPTLIFGDSPLWGAGTMVLSKYRGVGTPLLDIVAGGDVSSPWSDAKIADGGVTDGRYEVLTIPATYAHGTRNPDETGGFVYAGDGSYDPGTAVNLLGGVLLNTSALNFGTAPSGGGGGGTTPIVSSVAVTPQNAVTAGGGTINFDWVVSGTGAISQGATCTTDLGTIDATGQLIAPAATSAEQTGHVTVRSTQDVSKSGTATFTVLASGTSPTPATRNVNIQFGPQPSGNLTGLNVSFYDESKAHLLTTARYQSGAQSTDPQGRMQFSFQSTLPAGGVGFIVVNGPNGLHYNGPCVVS